jgi:hypothetical protein
MPESDRTHLWVPCRTPLGAFANDARRPMPESHPMLL